MSNNNLDQAGHIRRTAAKQADQLRQDTGLDQISVWLSRNFGWYAVMLAMILAGGLWLLWRW